MDICGPPITFTDRCHSNSRLPHVRTAWLSVICFEFRFYPDDWQHFGIRVILAVLVSPWIPDAGKSRNELRNPPRHNPHPNLTFWFWPTPPVHLLGMYPDSKPSFDKTYSLWWKLASGKLSSNLFTCCKKSSADNILQAANSQLPVLATEEEKGGIGTKE